MSAALVTIGHIIASDDLGKIAYCGEVCNSDSRIALGEESPPDLPNTEYSLCYRCVVKMHQVLTQPTQVVKDLYERQSKLYADNDILRAQVRSAMQEMDEDIEVLGLISELFVNGSVEATSKKAEKKVNKVIKRIEGILDYAAFEAGATDG